MEYPKNHMLSSQRNGLNHVGMNMSVGGVQDFDRNLGPIRNHHYPIYSDALLNWYHTKNVKSVRLLFTWEAVQRNLNGPITTVNEIPGNPPPENYVNYWEDLTSPPPAVPNPLKPGGVLPRLLEKDIYVILCPWQYNKDTDNTDILYDNAPFTSSDFANFWGKFATAINGVTGNDQRVAFDLINEPHTPSGGSDQGICLEDWFTCAQAAIEAIRAAGATNTIFVPGMEFTAAHSFTTNGSSIAWLEMKKRLEMKDPSAVKNIAVTVHCYDGITNVDEVRSTKPKKVLPDACSELVKWARTQGVKVNIGEIALDAGCNNVKIDGRCKEICGRSFCSESTFTHAKAQWTDWNKFCHDNDDVIVGWNWWANSEEEFWDQADSCQGKRWGLTLDDGKSQTIYMDLIEDTL